MAKAKNIIRIKARDILEMIESNIDYSLPDAGKRGYSHFALSIGKNRDLILKIGGRNFK